MSSSDIPLSSQSKNTSSSGPQETLQSKNTSPSSPQKTPSEKQLGKRKRDDFDLDEDFYKSFSWNQDSEKRIKLDTQEGRKDAINARPSFANLVSSASLILPPEIDTVVITREKFVVEWNESLNNGIPPTQVTPTLASDREETIKEEIHKNAFNIPFYYCNASTSSEIINRITEEKRIIVSSQISDVETSLSPLQLKRAASVLSDAFNEKAKRQKVSTSQDKLLKVANSINDSLEYFRYIPAENVPVRDKRTVSVLFKYVVFIRTELLILYYYSIIITTNG